MPKDPTTIQTEARELLAAKVGEPSAMIIRQGGRIHVPVDDAIDVITTALNLRDEVRTHAEKLNDECLRIAGKAQDLELELSEALARIAALTELLRECGTKLAPFLPIVRNDTPDYAELTFGNHQTQAMTMDPQTWLALNALPQLLSDAKLGQMVREGGEAVVEKLARALSFADWGVDRWDTYEKPNWEFYFARARAVLSAMQEMIK